ncbi:Wzz/FepE/Etk N-terminal domain-containing protein [Tenacibaculum sp. UWU-22]|uniref:Wzz/FepE/Etk N-terminal domain-containing protein n=1 Tax=Tenacibaculum sp. UWU-22 TaxID=3234187 RepID=UPI0034DAC9E7
MQEEKQQEFEDSGEIDFVKLLKTVVESKKTILKIILIFAFIGLFLAVFSVNKYTASTVFLPQVGGEKVGGSLGGLAALAGVNISGGSEGSEIVPSLYPQIINSIPFQRELLNTKLTIKGQEKQVSYAEYYTEVYNPGFLSTVKKYTIGLPSLLLASAKKEKGNRVSSDSIIVISNKEKGLINRLKEQLSLSINNKDNYVTISVEMEEPIVAAEMTYQTEKLLEKYVIAYKVKKSKQKLDFIKKRYDEKEKEFKIAQEQLASYQDRNQFSSTARSKTRLLSLQAQYDLAFNVYNDLAKQLEAQEIQVKENTPIFTILKPTSVPVNKSNMSKMTILLVTVFIGFLIGLGVVFAKKYYNELKFT